MLSNALQGQIVVNAAYVLIFVAVFIIGRMIMKEAEALTAQESLAESSGRKASHFLIKSLRPVYSQYIAPLIIKKPRWDKQREKYKQMIASAGIKDEITPDEFIAFKFTMVIVLPLFLGLMKTQDVDIPPIAIWLSGPLGWLVPDQIAKGLIEARQKAIKRAMPFIIDLLALSTEAGLDFAGAIGKVVEKANPSPLIEEFGQVLREVRVGSSRSDALREMGNRINMIEIGSFVAILISSDQMGASIGKTLRQQSEQIRSQRTLEAEKAGATAASKLMFPTIGLGMPAVMIMVLGPTIVQWLSGGSGL
ncbi:MAG: type II secretion system F family protein [Xanthomonadaceae bacterium]|nr:type II secretion system F family protein [Xanthomonadaceae bacterium]